MALPIRKGATHKVVVGPFPDVGDGFTPQTDIAISGTNEAEAILHDNATVVDISGYTWAAIANCRGYYHLTLQTGITNTIGHLTIVVQDDSDCLPVKQEFIVMSTTAYDALYAATSTLITTLDIGLLYESTIGTVNSQTSFDMDDAIITDDNWIGQEVIIEDISTGDNCVRWVSDVDQTNDRIIINAVAPFTVVATDVIRVKDTVHPTYALNLYDPPTRAEATTDANSMFTTALTESYAADGAAPTPAQALFLIQQMLTEFAISGTTLTMKKVDGSTTAATFTLDDAVNPTSLTRAS